MNIEEEKEKCRKNPIYFINTYVKINSPIVGVSQIKLYDYQQKLINKIYNNRFNICVSTRSSGKTLMGLLSVLHTMIFYNHQTVGIFGFNNYNTSELLNKLRILYNNLPDWLKPELIHNSKTSLGLSNGSRVHAKLPSNNIDNLWWKAPMFDLIFFDEFAYLSDRLSDNLLCGLQPLITSSRCKVIIMSTPKGKDNFHKIWKDAKKHKNKFVTTRINWDDVPGRDTKWKNDVIRNYGRKSWSVEWKGEFS